MLRRFRDGIDRKQLGFLENGFQFRGFDLVRTLSGVADQRNRLPNTEQKAVLLLIIARHSNHPIEGEARAINGTLRLYGIPPNSNSQKNVN